MKRLISTIAMILLLISVAAAQSGKQAGTKSDNREAAGNIQTSAAPNTVAGSGTAGRMSKWAGVFGSSTFTIGDSNITEDKFGKVGVNTASPTSPLTVQGMIETTVGGLKFPDGTVQTTVGLASVFHDATLTGNGMTGSPVGVAVPLNLAGAVPRTGNLDSAVISVANTGEGGSGVIAIGGTNGGMFPAGAGVLAFGADSSNSVGGDGIRAFPGRGRAPGFEGAAGTFLGDVVVTEDLSVQGDVSAGGNLTAFGVKQFKIDHPLDPERKYLLHAAIESSEVLNVYSGNVSTDEEGEATVSLPDWFEALNRDFRYQLTVVGTFAQAIVSDEIRNNRFKVRTNVPGVKVSWQVTGIRSDAVMQKHPFKVERDKPERERGTYLSPEAFNQPQERGVEYARRPELMRQMKDRREAIEGQRSSPKSTLPRP